MAKILIYGSRDFGVVLKRLVIQCGHEFIGFVDDWHTGPEVLGTFDQVSMKWPAGSCEVVLAVGYKHLAARRKLLIALQDSGYDVCTLIHPAAVVSPDSRLEAGVTIMAGAVIDSNAVVGAGSVVWPGAVLNHDVNVGANSFISPNATVCGYVNLGESCFVGAGATIVDHIDAPAHTFIKAGSVYVGRKPLTID